MKRIVSLLAAALFFTASVSGGTASDAGAGGASTASAFGARSLSWNPAGAAMMEGAFIEAAGTYDFAYNDVNRGEIGILAHVDRIGYFGFGAAYSDAGIAPAGIAGSDGYNMDFGASFVYANKLFYLLNYGVSVKSRMKYTYGEKEWEYSADAGLLYQPVPSQELFLGIYGGNLLAHNRGEDGQAVYSAGISYRILNGWINLKYDAVKVSDAERAVSRAGGEIFILEKATLRAGVNDMKLTAGAGFKYREYGIDYSFEDDDDYRKEVHKASLILTW